MAAKDDDERKGRKEGGGREIKGRDQTGRSILSTTAYAFIIIHKISRRFYGLPSTPRTGSKRLIENRKEREHERKRKR